MRDSLRRHHDPLALEDRRCLSFRHIDDIGFEANTAPGGERPAWYVAPLSSKRGPQHRKRAGLLDKQTPQERRKIGGGIVAGGTDHGQRLLPHLVAQPEERGQIGDVVGMKMADGHPPQVGELRLSLAKTAQSAAAHIDEDPGLITDPEQIAR